MAKQVQEPKVAKVEKVNRQQAANRVVAEMKPGERTTLGELAGKADALVVAGGGEAKPKETSWHIKRALATAEALGAVKLVKPSDLQVERLR